MKTVGLQKQESETWMRQVLGLAIEFLLEVAHKILVVKMLRKITETGNKMCMKHLFLSRKFA